MPPINLRTLQLNESHAQEIRAHGVATYPHECCGALLGIDADSGREVRALHKLVNRRTDSPRNRFSVTSDDVRDAEKAAELAGLEVVGWYHSHPDHPALPSEFDREHAWPWYSYVIVSIMAGEPKAMASWRLADDRMRFEPEKMVTSAGVERVTPAAS